jgi:non-heme chloroperoxidase
MTAQLHDFSLEVARSASKGLSYSRRGSGASILLVHGWCLNRNLWMYLEHSLVEAGFDVVAVDLAGFGSSADLAGPYGLERHASDLVALCKELDLTGVTAVGFAYGAAVLMSLEDDSRFAGLVCIGTPSAAQAPYGKMRTAMLRDWPRFASRSARAICAREQSEETLAWLAGMFVSTRLRTAIDGVESLAEFEPLGPAQQWSVPSLFVHGVDDTIVPPAVSRECATTFTGAELKLIPDCGHLVILDQPYVLSNVVIEFATRVGP